MALAAAEAGSATVDCDKGDENQVRLDDRCPSLGLHDAERTGFERVAGAET